MLNKKKIFLIVILLMIFVLYKLNNYSTSEILPIQKLEEYLNGKNTKEPTLNLYKSLDIKNINDKNIKEVNNLAKKIINSKDAINKYITYPGGKRVPIYHYNPNQNYNYNFNNSYHKEYNLYVKNGIVKVGDLPSFKGKTLFLKLKCLSNTIVSKLFFPSIQIKYKGKIYNYTQEYEASGIRYLNISDINLTSNSKISIIGKFLSIPEQNATLISFPNPDLKNKKILIISPHPDDAEIAAYGLYSNNHNNIYIVTITAGEAGPDKYYRDYFTNKTKRYIFKGEKRTWDSINIPALGGVKYDNIINLGFFDGRLGVMYRHPQAIIKGIFTNSTDINLFRKLNRSPLAKELKGSANWKSLVDNLSYLLQKIKPDIIVTVYPAIDHHPDHKYSSIALFQAIKKCNYKHGKLFLYSNHLEDSEYFPFGNQGDPISLPPTMPKTIYFNSIFSYHLNHITQAKKLFALEEMSDLRFDTNAFEDPCKDKNPLVCKDISYYRRAVRSNELFFIIDIKNLYNKEIYKSLK